MDCCHKSLEPIAGAEIFRSLLGGLGVSALILAVGLLLVIFGTIRSD